MWAQAQAEADRVLPTESGPKKPRSAGAAKLALGWSHHHNSFQ